MIRTSRWILLLILMLTGTDCFSLSPSSATQFTVLLAEQGLTIGSVQTIYQDSTGFVWLGGPDGLARYDGYHFEIFRYDPSNTNSISNSAVWDILEDHAGNLWVATDGGLNRFVSDTNQFIHYQHQPDNNKSLIDNITRSLAEDAEGNLWIGTYGGLDEFNSDRTQLTHYLHNPEDNKSLAGNLIKKIFIDHQGIIWIGTDGTGLNRFDRNTKIFEQYINQPANVNSLTHNVVLSIMEDRQHNLWIGTDGGGLNKFNYATKEFTHYLHDSTRSTSISDNRVFSILEDRQNNLWVGTENSLNVLPPATNNFIHIRHNDQNPQSMANDFVQSIFEDHNGDIWVGTFPSGASFLDSGNMAFISHSHVADDPNSLSANSVLSVLEDTQGKLWFGTDGGGLNKFDPSNQQMTYYRHKDDDHNSLSGNSVLSITEDYQGKLWLGIWGGGLNRLDPTTEKINQYRVDYQYDVTLSVDNAWKVYADKQHDLWVGTIGGGLNQFDAAQNHFTHYVPIPDKTSIASFLIWSIYEDHHGSIWLGTGNGLDRFDKNTHEFTHYKHLVINPNSLSFDIVLSLHEDKQGYIWVGTRGAGLDRLDPASGNFKHYNQNNGLPGNVVVSIEEDDHGNLWLGTNNGLARLNIATGKVRSYDKKNGLQGNEFNIGAAAKLRSGELIFGGSHGYTQFQPDTVIENNYLPRAVIRDLQVLNKSVHINGADGILTKTIDHTSSITLNYTQSVFSLEFAALGFRHAENNQYAYRLVGFDKDWNVVGAKRSATYTNLNAGTYTFEVKASNNEGLWNDIPASLQILILPPPWKTWWAYSLYALAVLLAICAFIYSQQKKVAYERSINLRLRNLDKMKNEFLANTSHELRTPLIGIIGLAESLADGVGGVQSATSKANLHMIIASGQRLANLVNDILDLSKLKDHTIKLSQKAVNLHTLVAAVLVLIKPMVPKGTIELINNIPLDCPAVYADEDRLQQILINLVGNAIKFTQTGSVTVTCNLQNEQLRISVIDTGIGIAPDEFARIFQSFEQLDGSENRHYGGTGLGLAVTRHLVKLHQGDIDVESTPGKGSTFHFTLPVCTPDLDMAANANDIATIAPEPEIDIDSARIVLPPMLAPTYTPISNNGKLHILIVDDEPINRQVLINHLSIENYQLSVASSGVEAIQLLDSGVTFDLVLLDIMMPRISGYDVCQHIRKKYSSHELPVIFLTAKNQAMDLATGFNVGANDFVTKPVSKIELLARINTHIALLETSRTLEQKVTERTSELEEKNRDLKLANLKLESISFADTLTGLNNRRFLYKTLPLDIALTIRAHLNKVERPPQDESDIIFFLLDIDHFKLVNDVYGHNNGDNILIQIANTLRKVCRESDHIIRWGGEEFLIVSRFTNRDQAPIIAERIRLTIEEQLFELDNQTTIHKTCSIGYVSFPFNKAMPAAIGLEEIINIADQCLYMVKHNQRNGWLGFSQKEDASLSYEQLLNDPGKYIESGELLLKTSITGKLHWNALKQE